MDRVQVTGGVYWYFALCWTSILRVSVQLWYFDGSPNCRSSSHAIKGRYEKRNMELLLHTLFFGGYLSSTCAYLREVYNRRSFSTKILQRQLQLFAASAPIGWNEVKVHQ